MVRRIVRGESGPTGGPAFTDVLGTCLAWGDGACVVQREDGSSVTIDLADIVSGKPVPPRPSVRSRVSVAAAESHIAVLSDGIDVTPLGAWSLRSEAAPRGRRRKRVNSCLAVGDPSMPVRAALSQVAQHYTALDIPPLLHVEAGSAIEDEVRGAGWLQVPGEAELRLASLAAVRRHLPRGLPDADLAISGPRAVASVGTGCDPLAEGHAALDGDWLGLHAIEVDPGKRRQGLGVAVVGALLEWGGEQGALTAWLHVETDNVPARTFWEALGFSTHHVMRYYAPR